MRSRATLVLVITILVVILDQASKIWIKTHFYLGEDVKIFSWFYLYFIENNGMAFGMELGSKLASLFPAGGGYAPIFLGRVVDMLYFPLFSFIWPSWIPFVGGQQFLFFQPIFNLADAAISCGIIVLIIFYHSYILPPKALAELPER